jgi:predicted small integral membrane protein
MYVRYLKISFVVFTALLCLIYAGQNIANLEACYQAFAYVMSNTEHAVYPASFGPSITSPVLIWLTLTMVVGFEILAGLLAARGAWDMWSARSAQASPFNASKKYALLGSGLGIFIWLGLFGVVAGAFFQMWQTTAGAASLAGAFQYMVSCAIVFIIIAMEDD